MGREIKRVPLDFNFPLGHSWAEFHRDRHNKECKRGKDDHDESCGYNYNEAPEGQGWQLWQTVSDGPISPVFRTPDELIDWMCQPVPFKDRRAYAPEAYPDNPWAQGWRRDIAEPFVKSCGWAPSAVLMRGVLLPGAEAMVMMKEEENNK